jgi:mannose-6-phosphate isomerase-like protein (cupin superfamily)
MADYTKKNLRDVDDAAVKGGFSDNQESRFATGDLDADSTGVSHHVVKPGKRQAFGHRHDEAEEVYVVLSGSGRIKLDDEIVDVAVLDAIRVAPPVMRQIEGGPDGIELIVFGPRHKGDGDIDPEFWAD